MAATNYTPIQLYHSTTASAVPVNTNLVDGELAINIADGKLYYKDSGGTVQVIATKGSGTIGGSNTQVQYNSSGALAGSANFTFNGTTATINTLNLTNALGAAYGGTAQSTYTQGDLLYASAANTLSKLAIGSNTYILTSNGTIPGWAAPSSISVNTATNLAGGAGGSVPYQSGAGATTFLSIGTANQVMTSSGSLPQWSSGLSITTLTASDAVTFSATTQNIALGTSQTTGTFTVGGAAQTGTQTFGQSTKTHTLNLGTGATESGLTKTINIGTAGVSGSTTTITIGSANGTSTTLNGTVTAATFNSTTIDTTNIEVTNIKAKDGTAALSIADSTGVVSVSANPVLSGGTANGVVYLNASKAATSGSALTYDGSYFTAASGTGAFFADIMQVSGTATKVNANGVGLEFRGGATPNITSYSRVGSAYLPVTLDALTSTFSISGTERMRLNSTSLNIGGNFTSTNNTLQVTGNAAIGYTTAAPTTGLIVAGNVGVGTDAPTRRFVVEGTDPSTNSRYVVAQLARATSGTAAAGIGGSLQLLAEDDAGTQREAALISWDLSNVSAAAPQGRLYLGTRGSNDAVVINNSGNLGLGVTPSSWQSGAKAIQIGARGFINNSADSTAVNVGNNCYYSGTNWIYQQNATASIYQQYSGLHAWLTAASGTAGNAITFTQAMTLDASGRLGIGQTTLVEALTVKTQNASTFINIQTSSDSGVYVGNNGGAMILSAGNTERARITSGGDLLVGSTSTSGLITGQLQLGTTSSSNAGIQFLNSTTGSGGLYFGDSTSGNARFRGSIEYSHISDAMLFGTAEAERARITSDGNLYVGVISPATAGRIVADGGDAFYAGTFAQPSSASNCIAVHNRGTSGNNAFVIFGTEAAFTTRGSIDYNRAGGQVRYNTTSDYRAKEVYGPVTDSGAQIDALKVYQGKMIGATQERPMMIAHEAQEVVPYAVGGEKDAVNADGTPKYQTMDHQILVPLLIAELQSLRARVAQLEAK